MTRRVAVRAIIVNDSKLLCVKLKPYKGALDGDYWSTVGGGIDDGEALIPALVREVIEETGIKPETGNLLYVQQYAVADKEQLEFFFYVTNPQDFLDIDLATTSHGDKEIAKIEFINPANEHVLPKFLKTQNFNNLQNQPVQVFNYL